MIVLSLTLRFPTLCYLTVCFPTLCFLTQTRKPTEQYANSIGPVRSSTQEEHGNAMANSTANYSNKSL